MKLKTRDVVDATAALQVLAANDRLLPKNAFLIGVQIPRFMEILRAFYAAQDDAAKKTGFTRKQLEGGRVEYVPPSDELPEGLDREAEAEFYNAQWQKSNEAMEQFARMRDEILDAEIELDVNQLSPTIFDEGIDGKPVPITPQAIASLWFLFET